MSEGTFLRDTIIIQEGSLGVGLTSSPSYKLHVSGNSYIDATSGSPTLLLGRYSGQTSIEAASDDGGYLIMDSSGAGTGRAALNWYSSDHVVLAAGGGNVGIGTTSPSQKLNITDGGILMTDENAGQPMFQARNYATSATGTFDNTYGFEYRHASSGSQTHGALIHLNENNNSRRTLTVSSGLGTIAQFTSAFYVGIATANPKARMQVVTTSDTSGTPTTYDDNGKYFTVGQGGETGGNVFISYDNTNNRGYIGALSPSVAWRNLILNPGGGNVGIGTTAPEDTLDIVGTLRISDNKTANTNKTNRIRGEHYDITEEPTTFMLMNNFSTTNILYIGGGSSIENAATQLNFYTAANNTTTQGSARMVIDSSGYVGIGTTSPASKLDILGSTNSSLILTRTSSGIVSNIEDASGYGALALYQAGGGVKAYITGNGSSYLLGGNFGIGTTSPSKPLTVENNSDQLLLQTSSSPSSFYTVLSSRYDSGHPFGLYVANNNSTSVEYMGVYADGGGVNNRVSFPTGNVGIGTTSPSSTLHVVDGTSGDTVLKVDGTNGTLFSVVDDLSDSLMSVNDSSGLPLFEVFADNHIVAGRYNQNDFYIDTNGNIGIGTSDPSSALDLYEQTGKDNKLRFHSSTTGTGISNGSRIGLNGSELFINNIENDAIKIYTQSTQTNGITIIGSGSVGVGTTSPLTNSLMTVNGGLAVGDASYNGNMNGGNADFSVDCNGTPQISWVGDHLQIGGTNQNWSMKAYTGAIQTYSQDLSITAGGTGTTYKLFLGTNGQTSTITCNNGNVGIGTTSPNQKLHIESSSDPGIILNKSASGGQAQIAFQSVGVTKTQITSNYSDNRMYVYHQGSNALVLDSGGRLGVGITPITSNIGPAQANIQGKGIAVTRSTNDAYSNKLFFLKDRSTDYSNTIVQASDSLGEIVWAGADGVDYASWGASIQAVVDGTPGANDLPTRLIFSTTADGASSPTERMRITSAGQLQVTGNGVISNHESGGNFSYLQQTSSDARLYVQYSQPLLFGTAATERMRIDANGNVGIGTTSPSRKLDISINGQMTFGGNVLYDGDQGIYWHSDANYGIFRTAGSWSAPNYQQLEIKWITGILLNPGSGLFGKSHVGVIGGVSIGTSYYATKQNNNLIVEGSVGIGTTSPSKKLDVRGDVKFVSTNISQYSTSSNSQSFIRLYNNNGSTKLAEITSYDYSGSVEGGAITLGKNVDNYISISGTTLSGGRIIARNASAVTTIDLNGSTGTVTATSFSGDGSNLTGISSGSSSNTQSQLSGTTTLTLDVGAYGLHVIPLANGTTISSITYSNSPSSGTVKEITVILKYSGTATVTWTNVIWSGAQTPTLTASNGKADMFNFTTYDGGSNWVGAVIAQDLVSTNL